MSSIKDLKIKETIKYYNVDSVIDDEEHSFLIPINEETITKFQQEHTENFKDGEYYSSEALEKMVRDFIVRNDEDPFDEYEGCDLYYHNLLFDIDQEDCERHSELRSFEPSKVEEIDENGIHFSNNREMLEKCSQNISGTYKIPYGVTTIGENAFNNCESLTSVEFPDTVTSIGHSAFSGCKSLQSIEIPSTVTAIEDHTFSECSSLASIKIPSTVSSIGKYAFYGCSSLTSIDIPEGVTELKYNLFCQCTSLKSVKIPDGVKTIGTGAFSGCSNLTSVEIPKSVTKIESHAFYDCGSLKSIELPEGIKYIGLCMFEDCINLESVNIPNSVECIGSQAFRGCKNLTSINIPHSVKVIQEYAFKECRSLTSLVIPESVVLIEEGITTACKGLESIVVTPDNPVYDSRNNCNAIIETAKNRLIAGCKSTKIFDGIESIGTAAFRGSDIESLALPDSVKYIEFGAFSNCVNLRSITIPANIIGIGYAAKSYTKEIRNGISMYTDAQPFSSCPNLTSITVCKDNPVYDSREDCNAIIETATNKLIVGCQTTKIPASVTEIGNGAFSNCGSLKSIDLPDGLKVIGCSAFTWCESLESITIPGTVTHIKEDAFNNCTKLKSVYLPDSITEIEYPNFYFCPELTIYIPKGTKKKYSKLIISDKDRLVEMDE